MTRRPGKLGRDPFAITENMVLSPRDREQMEAFYWNVEALLLGWRPGALAALVLGARTKRRGRGGRAGR